jgi:uncharacterized protein YqhQ
MKKPNLKLPNYGGQALIEGVLMRGQKHAVAALRLSDGTIKIVSENLNGIYQKGIFKFPFIRGLMLLWDSLILGFHFLTISANMQTKSNEKIEGPALTITVLLSLGISIALFFVTPAAISRWLGGIFGWHPISINLLEGSFRLILVLIYLWAISLMPDIRRVFQYHGAEHKTINAFESGVKITKENVIKFSTQHPRCGTSFLLTVIILSILVFSLFGKLTFLWTIITRILLIPVIAMIAYEYIRFISQFINSPAVKILIWPNLALQHLTAHQPSMEMIEVAIEAFNHLLINETKSLPDQN